MAGMSARKAVTSANSLTDQDLSKLAFSALQEGGLEPSTGEHGISFATKKGKAFTLGNTFHTSPLENELNEKVLVLLRSNMKEMYDRSKSIEWNDEEKLQDIVHPTSRLILAFETPTQGGQGVPRLAGFVLFRFDKEDCDPEDPTARIGQDEVEVAYCYELQIAPEAQGCGLGKILMGVLEQFARAAKMRKVMLTCFSFNSAARSFYEAQGYGIDFISPSSEDEDSDEEDDAEEEIIPDYRIMSKNIYNPS
ncbi:unnamed protein product [Tilletia controversa]|uniref:N-alpha-acetyltransferase 40 n=1 Tax=Tilletia controversa TaxID=13291 RepID=A0A8X7MX93_9BASI|nr:hypothetical protein CF328_g2475 [Tilletia controversa]KAE8251778.1 hypothetical protein A4X06_0g2537 [Tilletia controversa]CAD6896088.1 unnamed protein product [Tilletia controversa]CAD6903870.1 unnamed protein product [Tilletia controversa]CAD6973319.1 unnamed protein product [Tilletia controversa]